MPGPSEDDIVIRAREVEKAYGPFRALTGISFTVQRGSCFGLLGPNGAGKSTLIKLLYGMSARTSGELEVLGLDPSRQARLLRRQTGVVMQEDALDHALLVRDNLLMFARYHALGGKVAQQVVDELLEFVGLAAQAQQTIAHLSGGMKRRLAFARSLLCRPKLLILDEPTTGLDPAVRQLLWEKITELKAGGTTIILTTHYMDEAEALCDQLLIIDQGQVQARGNPRSLIDQFVREGVIQEHTAVARPANLEDVFLGLTRKRRRA